MNSASEEYWLDGLELPRKNGELVFDEPWQGRVFCLALAVRSQRPHSWTAFCERLRADTGRLETDYYGAWLDALELVLHDQGLLAQKEVDVRAKEYETGL